MPNLLKICKVLEYLFPENSITEVCDGILISLALMPNTHYVSRQGLLLTVIYVNTGIK